MTPAAPWDIAVGGVDNVGGWFCFWVAVCGSGSLNWYASAGDIIFVAVIVDTLALRWVSIYAVLAD